MAACDVAGPLDFGVLDTAPMPQGIGAFGVVPGILVRTGPVTRPAAPGPLLRHAR